MCALFFIVLTARSWIKNVDYYRLDGSTNAMLRKKWADQFNNVTNVRYRFSDLYFWLIRFRPSNCNVCLLIVMFFVLAADYFSSRREPAPSASTSSRPTGWSSLMPRGTPRTTSRAFTECTASASSNPCLSTASWLRWAHRSSLKSVSLQLVVRRNSWLDNF